MALALKKLGHEVTAITSTIDKAQAEGLKNTLDSNQIKIIICPHIGKSSSFINAVNLWLRGFIRPSYNIGVYSAIISTGPYVTWSLRHIYKQKCKIITVVNAMGHDGRSLLKPKIGAYLLNKYSDFAIALCHLEKIRLEKLGVIQGKIKIIYNPLDLDIIYHLAEQVKLSDRQKIIPGRDAIINRKIIACLASFQMRKCQALLIEAFSKLSQDFMDFDLVLAGEGEEKSRCEDLALNLGLAEKVFFTGRLNNNDAISLIAAATLVVHCSNAETFGYSMVEPLLLEIPTLVTCVGIGWEMKKINVAEVVPVDNILELTAGLKRVLIGGPEIEDRRSRGKKFAEDNFDVHIIARKFIDFIQH